MKLRVLFFSVLRDITSVSEFPVDLPPDARTVSDLLAHLFERWPRLGEWEPSLLIAVDHVYAKRDALVHDGAEVAIMPPVQGG